MDEFAREWLAHLALDELDTSALRALLRPCGQACAQPCILPMYQRLLEQCESADAFFAQVNEEVPEVGAEIVEPNRVYEVTYARCLCPLHTEGPIHTAALCLCSEQSLQFVMEQLFAARRPRVTLRSSVLGGAKKCRLRIELATE